MSLPRSSIDLFELIRLEHFEFVCVCMRVQSNCLFLIITRDAELIMFN